MSGMPEMTHLREGFITTRTAARILGCTTSAVRLMAHSGRLATTTQNGKRKHMQVLLSEVQGVAADRSYQAAEMLAKQVKVTERLEAEAVKRTTAAKVAAEVPALPVVGRIASSVTKGMNAKRLTRIEAKLDRLAHDVGLLLSMWEGE